MPNQVSAGAILTCSFGMAPSTLLVLPGNRVLAENKPAANIMDRLPLINIQPFGMCNSPANPMVAAATAAAMGVLMPIPCVPATSAPWIPGAATVLIGAIPALDNTSTCLCMWGGVIRIAHAGTVKTMIP